MSCGHFLKWLIISYQTASASENDERLIPLNSNEKATTTATLTPIVANIGGYTETDTVAAVQDKVLGDCTSGSESDPAIDVRNLTKSYGKVLAVDSISFQVLPGESFGLVGLNGAGKTTTVMMLSSLLNPDSGSATVCGHDIVRDKGGVRESIGLVFEEEAVDIYLTGKENLDFAARMYNLPKHVREERVADVLKTVGLGAQANSEVRNYSGGMLRRLEIARGMLTSPEILFLDEPTIGLDVQTRRYLWDYIKQLNREKGTTILLSTSYLDEADYLCNRIAIMDEGRILVIGAPDQLKAHVGKQVITLKLSNGSDEQFVQRLRAFGWVKDVERMNSSLVLSTEDKSIGVLEIVKLATKQGLGVSSVKSSRPTLDDVLLHYTGKRISEVGGR
jgi:ABC-2 type transport system ATP-binding protein